MNCINKTCAEELEMGAEFCPFCGTEQTQTVQAEPSLSRAATTTRTSATPRSQTSVSTAPVSHTSEVLEMRAGESIWGFTEPEKNIKPGQRRPMLIMDEHVEYLAHTDQRLTPDELLRRVKFIIEEQNVPVEARIVDTRWVSDPATKRQRVIASLRDHSFSDIKMIMGVDYMGKWASIQLHLGTEPEPIPPEPEDDSWGMPMDAVIALILGGLFFLLGAGGGSDPMLVLGVLAMGYGAIRASYSKKLHTEKLLAKKALRLAEKKVKEFQKTVERLSRTFKVDDMRLFCRAMEAVFQRVVDDIVQTGGEVVRVEGGKGGFFESDVEHSVPTPRRADAAAAGV